MYRVQFFSHCGMVGIPSDYESREDAAAKVKRRNAAYRKLGYYVTKVDGRPNTWEYQAEDEGGMVGDSEGLLTVRRIRARRRVR